MQKTTHPASTPAGNMLDLSTLTPVSRSELTGLTADLLLPASLLTPRLTAYFGPLEAQSQLDPPEGHLQRRHAQLTQVSTGDIIVEAQLVLYLDHLPQEVLQALSETRRLFGDLLMAHGIPTRVDALTVVKCTATEPPRFGRHHHIHHATTGARLCDVYEVLTHPNPAMF